MVCAALTALLVSPISWTHHWVWCVPVLVLLAAEAAAEQARPPGLRRMRWRPLLALGLLTFLGYGMWLVPTGTPTAACTWRCGSSCPVRSTRLSVCCCWLPRASGRPAAAGPADSPADDANPPREIRKMAPAARRACPTSYAAASGPSVGHSC
ncbi:hypothetical protein GXW82_24875 [Streptacidiphilus sp. 4-A2]|nr:hypothetical protein [Streptacidiphilus sp. 4-A2]